MNNDSNISKFDNCKFRSEGEEVRLIKRCSCQGGDYTEHGYVCSSKQIFKVTPEICANCEIFEPK